MSIANSTQRHHSTLLIDEEPLQVLPSLAVVVGLNESIILQQMHYWLHPKRKSGRVVDGQRWIFNSYKQWQDQFPFWTEKIIGNAIRSLERQGVLLSRQDLNGTGSDRRKWYTINYNADAFAAVRPDPDGDDPDGDIERPDLDVEHTHLGRSSITENTSETTTRGSTRKTDTLREEFESFWSHYPRKTDKDAAWKAWQKINPSPELQATILIAVNDQKRNNWHGKDKSFIPHGSTWLNRKRWEDEIIPPQGVAAPPSPTSLDDLRRSVGYQAPPPELRLDD